VPCHFSKEALVQSARAGEKDLLLSRRRLIQRFPKGEWL
jgi:hypothetical protein